MTTYDRTKIHYEYFTDTTDGSGDIIVTLEANPAATKSILLYSSTVNAQPAIQSLSTNQLTIRFYKYQYSKTDTATTTLNSLPGSVSSQSTKQNTSGDPAGASPTVNSDASPTFHPFTQPHVHGVSFQYIHDHALSVGSTPGVSLAALTSTVVKIAVIYA